MLNRRKKRSKKSIAAAVLTHPDVLMLAAVGAGLLKSGRSDDPIEALAPAMLSIIYMAARPMVIEQRHSAQGI